MDTDELKPIVVVAVVLVLYILFLVPFYSKPASKYHQFFRYYQFLPIIGFIFLAIVFGMTEYAWQYAFKIGSIFAVLFTILTVRVNLILDRLMLGANIFLIIGSIAFLYNLESILHWYGAYQGAAIILPVVVVGILTTFYSPSGFIGIESSNKKAIRSVSLQLLAASVVALVWAIVFNRSGFFIAGAIPFIALKIIQTKLVAWKFHKNTI